MVGTTLIEFREHIEALASDDGPYSIICGRTGERPIPTAGKHFDGRSKAQFAVRIAERYRSLLRHYDPQLPYYDLIVCHDTHLLSDTEENGNQRGDDDRRNRPESALRDGVSDVASERLVEFCHRVAVVVFETLSDSGFEAVESAVMETYFDLAPTVADPDDLCLYLLETMAIELHRHLDPTEQTEVLERAAERLATPHPCTEPVTATFTRLQHLGMVGCYARPPMSLDLESGSRSIVVRFSDYALSPRNGRLPILPIVLELGHRQLDWSLTSLQVATIDDGWQVSLTFEKTANPEMLASVPIQPGV